MIAYKTNLSELKVGMLVFHTLNLQLGTVLYLPEKLDVSKEDGIKVMLADYRETVWFENVQPATIENLVSILEKVRIELYDLRTRLYDIQELVNKSI